MPDMTPHADVPNTAVIQPGGKHDDKVDSMSAAFTHTLAGAARVKCLCPV